MTRRINTPERASIFVHPGVVCMIRRHLDSKTDLMYIKLFEENQLYSC